MKPASNDRDEPLIDASQVESMGDLALARVIWKGAVL